ncbi:hypothetical protein CDAR_41771 [Caerostris darwini]|uniref:Uncharacterized protein n=1 Tax=Caerostris darwini TaxID=1538125 RepID=A0AAV4PCQ0_9ARAC|nr:hypothetical protein CDAR_374261 [Caerostris darwini]GIY79481.1 hypothetical protein CDAR_41771 [Caerostris darwini]
MYIPIRFIKKLLKHNVLTEWQNHWVNSAKGRAVFEIYEKINPKRTLRNFFLNQIITGHGAIASYQHKFFNGSSICSCGLFIEDRNHLIFQCINWTFPEKETGIFPEKLCKGETGKVAREPSGQGRYRTYNEKQTRGYYRWTK